jgi:hypothetical protein
MPFDPPYGFGWSDLLFAVKSGRYEDGHIPSYHSMVIQSNGKELSFLTGRDVNVNTQERGLILISLPRSRAFYHRIHFQQPMCLNISSCQIARTYVDGSV